IDEKAKDKKEVQDEALRQVQDLTRQIQTNSYPVTVPLAKPILGYRPVVSRVYLGNVPPDPSYILIRTPQPQPVPPAVKNIGTRLLSILRHLNVFLSIKLYLKARSAFKEYVPSTSPVIPQEPYKTARVIPVGKRGERSWPFSCQGEFGTPKPLLTSPDDITFLQYSLERAALGIGIDYVYLITDITIQEQVKAKYKDILRRKFNRIVDDDYINRHVFIEPEAANTAAVIGVVAIQIRRELGSNTVVHMMTTDHDFPEKDYKELQQSFERIEEAVGKEGVIGLLGIDPYDRTDPNNPKAIPDVNMGYIKLGNELSMVEGVYTVSAFREKPESEEFAQKLIDQGCLWSSGKNCFRVDRILEAFELFAPEYSGELAKISRALGTEKEKEVLISSYARLYTWRRAIEKTILEPAALAIIPKDMQEALRKISDLYRKGDDKAIKDVHKDLENVVKMASLAYEAGVPVRAEDKVNPFGVVVGKYAGRWEDLGNHHCRWLKEKGRIQGQPKEVDPKDNLARAQDKSKVTMDNCLSSNVILQPDDTTTKVHAYNLKDMVIAYNYQTKSLLVVPMDKDDTIRKIVSQVNGAPSLRQYALLEKGHLDANGNPVPEIIPTSRYGIELCGISPNNRAYLAKGGDAVIVESENCRVFSEEGFVGLSNCEGIVVIKQGNEIFVYGPETNNQGDLFHDNKQKTLLSNDGQDKLNSVISRLEPNVSDAQRCKNFARSLIEKQGQDKKGAFDEEGNKISGGFKYDPATTDTNTYYAQAAAGTIMLYYELRGKRPFGQRVLNYKYTLRDKKTGKKKQEIDMQLVDFLADLATDPNEAFHNPAAAALFGSLIEGISDSFSHEGRNFYYYFFSR
ncbi:MAG: hypothetical protein KKD63_16540, partial [Proteobacteria bacterium]|nr:hypothetical protein [Pseudomonadota bacterium]